MSGAATAPLSRSGAPPYADVLRWLASASRPCPSEVDGDGSDDALVEAIDAHGLAGRFLRRLEAEPVPWATPQLRDAVADLQAETRRRVTGTIAALREITAALGSQRPPVVIKGMATWQLTGRPETLRCGDLDIVVPDDLPLDQLLDDLGYERTSPPFLHSTGEYHSEERDVDVDLHAYFPVYAYSPDLRAADLRPARHPGDWSQGAEVDMQRLGYADLLATAHESRRPGQGGVVVPGPEVQALVLCSHAFMNFTNVWSISHRPKPYVRLCEIADLAPLAEHPSFDRDRFAALAERFGAEDCLEWVAWVSGSLLGEQALAVPPRRGRETDESGRRFPRCLWWRFWADVPVEPEALLARPWLAMNELVAQLRPEVLSADRGRTRMHTTVPDGEGPRLRRVITLAGQAAPVRCRIGAARMDGGVRVTAEVERHRDADSERVRVDLGAPAVEWIHEAHGRATLVGDRAEVELAGRDGGYDVSFVFAREQLPEPALRSDELSLLVGVSEFARGSPLASVLVPLRVTGLRL